jgi:GxxExxY protein
MTENEISAVIIDSALEVHKTMGGPGLLESVYEECLAWEIEHRGLRVERQKELPLFYKGNVLGNMYRLDLLIEKLVIIECKAVENFNTVYLAQALTYLRLSGIKLALVINFGQKLLRNGIHRVVNGL